MYKSQTVIEEGSTEKVNMHLTKNKEMGESGGFDSCLI